MTHRGNAGPLCSWKVVTILVALSAELRFLEAGIQLRDNGYDGVLVAINPQVPESQILISNIQVSGSLEINTIIPLNQIGSFLYKANNHAWFLCE